MATAIGSGVFHLANYIIFALFLLITAGIGLYYACSGGRQCTTSEFLMGNRRLQMLPVAVSIFVSYASGVIVIGHPAEIYIRATLFTMRALGHVLGCLLSSSFIVPLFFRLGVTARLRYILHRISQIDILIVIKNFRKL